MSTPIVHENKREAILLNVVSGNPKCGFRSASEAQCETAIHGSRLLPKNTQEWRIGHTNLSGT